MSLSKRGISIFPNITTLIFSTSLLFPRSVLFGTISALCFGYYCAKLRSKLVHISILELLYLLRRKVTSLLLMDDWKLRATPVVRLRRPNNTFVHILCIDQSRLQRGQPFSTWRLHVAWMYICWVCTRAAGRENPNPNSHGQIFRIVTARYAESLWRMRRHGPVIAHCTDSENFLSVQLDKSRVEKEFTVQRFADCRCTRPQMSMTNYPIPSDPNICHLPVHITLRRMQTGRPIQTGQLRQHTCQN